MTSSNPNSLPKTPSPNTKTFGLDLQHMNGGGSQFIATQMRSAERGVDLAAEHRFVDTHTIGQAKSPGKQWPNEEKALLRPAAGGSFLPLSLCFQGWTVIFVAYGRPARMVRQMEIKEKRTWMWVLERTLGAVPPGGCLRASCLDLRAPKCEHL